MRVLVSVASRHGGTLDMGTVVADALREAGHEVEEVSPDDVEAPYFDAHMTRATYGVVRVALTRARLDVAFVPAAGSDYTDAFTIDAPPP